MVEKLKTFITENNLDFTEGRRNSDCVIISGYALHLEASFTDVCNAIPEEKRGGFLGTELERVYHYADKNNYAKFWSTEDAKKLYKF